MRPAGAPSSFLKAAGSARGPPAGAKERRCLASCSSWAHRARGVAAVAQTSRWRRYKSNGGSRGAKSLLWGARTHTNLAANGRAQKFASFRPPSTGLPLRRAFCGLSSRRRPRQVEPSRLAHMPQDCARGGVPGPGGALGPRSVLFWDLDQAWGPRVRVRRQGRRRAGGGRRGRAGATRRPGHDGRPARRGGVAGLPVSGLTSDGS